MSLTTNATNVLAKLQTADDPLTRYELANMLEITELELVRAIAELKQVYEIEVLNSGYRLLDKDSTPNLQDAGPEEQLLAIMATSLKRFYPLTLHKRTGLPQRVVDKTLQHLVDEKLVHHRSPGTYYLRQAAVDYINKHYPAIKVIPAVLSQITLEDNDNNYTFTIKSQTPKHLQLGPDALPAETTSQFTLVEIPQKIDLLQQQLLQVPAEQAVHLQQLITFLQLHTGAAA